MYAVIPGKAKPSKSASKDHTRPVLTHAELRETPDGWEIVTCDSYQLARVPLDVKDDDGEPLVAGPISMDALVACEKSRGFRANGSIEPCDTFGRSTGQSFQRNMDVGQFPNWDQLIPEAPESDVELVIGLNPHLLYALAQSLDVGKNKGVFLRVRRDASQQLKAIAVSANGIDYNGLLMPIRPPS